MPGPANWSYTHVGPGFSSGLQPGRRMRNIFEPLFFAQVFRMFFRHKRPASPGPCFYRRIKGIMRKFVLLVACFVFPRAVAPSQTTTPDPANTPQGAASSNWSLTAAASAYFIPHSEDYVSPTLSADHGRLHLEARYNYEALRTGSLWVGFNVEAGKELKLTLSPMVGGVFGKLNGIAPGYNLNLSYRRISFFSQGEYVFDLADRSGNFFYAWNELAYSPLEWLRAGMAAQRTRVYQTDLSIQRGPFVAFSLKRVGFGAYVFNVGWTDPTVVLSFTVSF